MHTLLTLILVACAMPASAGPLADALEADDANLYFSFETREGVWGDGRSLTIDLDGDRKWIDHDGRHGRDMTEGPAHVWIRKRDGHLRVADVLGQIRLGAEKDLVVGQQVRQNVPTVAEGRIAKEYLHRFPLTRGWVFRKRLL